MIIQSQLKLDKFYCIEVMNWLKKIFFVNSKINVKKLFITSSTEKKSCKKQKKDILKKKHLIYIGKTKKQ